MVNKYIILFLLLFPLLVTSCAESKGGYKDTMTCPVDSLQSEMLNDSFMLARPQKLFLADSLLIVADATCGDNLFYVFRASDGSFLKGGGRRGEAPGEVLSFDKIHLDSQKRVVYWDMYKSKLIFYDIKELLSDSVRYFTETALNRGEVQNTSLLDVIPLESGYLYNGNTVYHIGFYGTSNSIDAPLLPDIPSLEIARAIMNRSCLEVSPDGKLAVQSTLIGGVVRCYNLDSLRVKEKWLKLFFPPVYKVVEGANPTWITWKQESQMGFEDLCVTNRHVYLLLNGKFAKDKPYANEILVMDWDGNVIKKYQLDCDIKTMAVDESNGFVYGITCGFDTEANIVRFSLY